MNILQNNYASIERMRQQLGTGKQVLPKADNKVETKNSSTSFAQVLQQKEQETTAKSSLHFSKHANERLESRNINLSEEQMSRLNKGIMQAKEKSINESLVMMDDIAFIVNIKNNTVITAIDMDAKTVSDALSDKTKLEGQTQERNVFTNIDGAVIV